MIVYKEIDAPQRNADGCLIGSKAIRMKWLCPVCGEMMGEPVLTRFREGTQTYWADIWNNPCRHITAYSLPQHERHKPAYLKWFVKLMSVLIGHGYMTAMCQDDTRDLYTLLWNGEVVGRLTCKMDFELLSYFEAPDPSIICHQVIAELGPPPSVEINRHELVAWSSSLV